MNPPEGSSTGIRPVALFVLGMPRSGTSALTRVLSLCGGALPTGLHGAVSDNPRGRWEPRASLLLNDAILRRHRSGAFDPTLRLQEEGVLDANKNPAYMDKIKAYLTTLPAAPLVVIKDLQINLLSGMWFEAARMVGFDTAALIAVRHPEEAIASLVAGGSGGGASPELASALWLKQTLLTERHTREVPRLFVEYANLLDDWRREITRISSALRIDLATRDEGAIEEFLTPDLRHHQQHSGPVTEPFGTDWFFTVYGALRAAAQDEAMDQPALDRVFEAYRASEHVFRTAFEEFRSIHNRNRLIPPLIARLGLEAVAMAHRRRGTWA
ncbi:sulfotransferase family protein [Mycobacterium sp. IS-1590]|uniref:sulfotransferase family protein n=1 Tax=Mycobacterium sp. IS-1590 TaxID=1772286 RepID=UPI000B04C844|nr:sulfotransferase family protein [Mycobacterium sp. IS-1590]